MYNNYKLLKVVPQNIFDGIINLRQLIFEVTDACNLCCTYCAFSNLYLKKRVTKNNFMPFSMAKSLIDYLFLIWQSDKSSIPPNRLSIGFYGGEPLLNFKLIENIVNYIDSIDVAGKQISYDMTTNAVLLNKYIDFFVKHNFSILVSLDGNEYAQGYRRE